MHLATIEYDGSYWHSGKIDIDLAKTLDLLDAGYLVARLPEAPLPPLPIDRAGYLEIVVRSIVPRPEQVIDQVANWVSRSART